MPMVVNPLTTQLFWSPCSASKACDVTVSWCASALLIRWIQVSNVPHAALITMHCVSLVPWKQSWTRINTSVNEANISFYNHLTRPMGKPLQYREKWDATWGVLLFKNTSIYQLILSRNGRKIFVKGMSNSIVGNLVWNAAYTCIVVKLAMELPEVTTIEPKCCWYWRMAVFLQEESSKLRWIGLYIAIKVGVNSDPDTYGLMWTVWNFNISEFQLQVLYWYLYCYG